MAECSKASHTLHRMAQGNHLASILAGSHGKSCSAYYSAMFLPGTEIQMQGESTPVKADPATQYDICVTSTDLSKLSQAVSVIVPGYGMGTVVKSSIVSITARPPSPSTPTSLDFVASSWFMPRLSTLHLFGHNLIHLNVRSLGNVGASTVREILVMCPKLKSLSIDHDGSFWARGDGASFDGLQILTELELGLDRKAFDAPSRAAASSALCRLEGLRLDECSSDFLPRSRDSIVRSIQHLPCITAARFVSDLIAPSQFHIRRIVNCHGSCSDLGDKPGDALTTDATPPSSIQAFQRREGISTA